MSIKQTCFTNQMFSSWGSSNRELAAFEQALSNPRSSTALNEWLAEKLAKYDARFDEMEVRFKGLEDKMDARFKEMDTKWEARFKEMDDKWEARFKEMDAKWEARFDKLEAKLDFSREFIDHLKEQNRVLKEQLDANHAELVRLLKRDEA